ncbi:MAG: hypothetical protein HYZ34_10090 [Ignavibacteriae bacterium]|nr:hypothetical protein [Ignavibacteriota bacterium]
MTRLLPILFVIILLSFSLFAQDSSQVATKDDVDEIQGALDGMNETMLEMKTTLDALKKIKVSGYIQAQFQIADTAGAKSLAGGDFPPFSDSRFQVRRGRVKVNYDNDLTQAVLQIDVTQGGVGIKDAYVSIKEPWLRTIGLTAGVFDRPFGFEISYSSSSRETPERSRMYQTLFPGERDLGAKIEIMPEYGTLSYFSLKAGIFNGVLPNANENDNNKDFIGRLGFTLPFEGENLAIDGGFSLYSGKVLSNNSKVYEIDNSAATKLYKLHSTTSDSLNTFGRTYYGFDAQMYYDLPVLGGMSLRGEFITGKQPGASSSSQFYNPATSTSALYLRNFSGWYLNYIQNIGLDNQFMLKYDVYDPNSDIEGNDIGASGSNLTAADVRFSTLGLGWIYHWDQNVKFVLYYDMVSNEKVNSSATGSLSSFKDDVKDNVLTMRVQYKF